MEEGSSVQDVTNTSLAELRKLLLHRLLEEKKEEVVSRRIASSTATCH